jgi:hypothetical protein
MPKWLRVYHRWRRFQVTTLLYPVMQAAVWLLAFPIVGWLSLQ